ncbi:MAG: FAD-dependent oxidoreductase [Candidatus Heimdallarchaeota archaeon]|nr:FAD-dependent oxidoreductase [Candidatus Heimdallarchaeota archaeon]
MSTIIKHDIIIIGAGPAGLSAALYAARAKLNVLVIDKSSAGGQVKTTHQVANYPGFVEPISGYQLASNMKKQAEKYGANFALLSEIEELHLTDDEKWVRLDDGNTYQAPYFILATGRSPRPLNIPGEHGPYISYCATCDGEFYQEKDIFVIGGGNSAMEESLLLLQHAKSVRVIHQFDELQAEREIGDKVKANPKVSFLWSHEPRAFEVDGDKITVEIENLKTNERLKETRDGVFIFVGMVPNSQIYESTDVELNDYKYISVNHETLETNISNVFAAGDVRDKHQWQITTAVNDGTIAAMEIIKRF